MQNNTVQSLARGCRILELVAYGQGKIRLQDIAADLNVGNSTAHNLAKTLCKFGYLECSSGKYILGEAIRELLSAKYRDIFSDAVKQSLAELSEKIPRLGLIYSEPHGMFLYVVFQTIASRPGKVFQPTNSTIHLYNSVSGVIFNALADPKLVSDYRKNIQFSEQNISLWRGHEQFNEAVLQARKDGFYACEPNPGFFCVAAPVLLPSGEFRGSVGGSILLDDLSDCEKQRQEKNVVQSICQTAAALSKLNY